MFPGKGMAPWGPKDTRETLVVNSEMWHTACPLCMSCLGSCFPKMWPAGGKIVSSMLLLYKHIVMYLWDLYDNPYLVTGPHWSIGVSKELIQKLRILLDLNYFVSVESLAISKFKMLDS